MNINEIKMLLERHGYEFVSSNALMSGGVGTHASGYKVAVDAHTFEWMWYRGRRDPSMEGRGVHSLTNWLDKKATRQVASRCSRCGQRHPYNHMPFCTGEQH